MATAAFPRRTSRRRCRLAAVAVPLLCCVWGVPCARAALEGLEDLTLRPTVFKLDHVLNLPFMKRVNAAWRYESVMQFRFNVFVSLPALTNGTKLYEYHLGRRSKEDEQLSAFRRVESYLDSLGFEGRSCLLRLICEVQKYPFRHHSIFGELLHRFLTPFQNSRKSFGRYLQAEREGRENGTVCHRRYEDCPFSLRSLVRNTLGSAPPAAGEVSPTSEEQ